MKNISKLFENQSLLDLALTHRSWLNENSNTGQSNERLEFLGDAVLEFVVSEAVYKKIPNQEEGYLTALRANLVNTVNLAMVARTLDFGSMLKLSKGEEEGGGRENQSLLANTVEAVIGGLFLDGGIKNAKNFINDYLLVDLDKKLKEPLKDPKSRLQEIAQAKGYTAPKYEVVEEKGPDHNKQFTLQVMIDNKAFAKGTGKNKSEAAQEAAKNALSRVSSL